MRGFAIFLSLWLATAALSNASASDLSEVVIEGANYSLTRGQVKKFIETSYGGKVRELQTTWGSVGVFWQNVWEDAQYLYYIIPSTTHTYRDRENYRLAMSPSTFRLVTFRWTPAESEPKAEAQNPSAEDSDSQEYSVSCYLAANSKLDEINLFGCAALPGADVQDVTQPLSRLTSIRRIPLQR